jgi:predicted enzyme related to lactoylglutathione lyase
MSITSNPVIYFEIPVNDMDRAIEFYSAVFDFTFEKNIIDHNEMAFFPFEDGARGITGALAKGEIYIPTLQGILIYFSTNDIDLMLEKVITYGGEILYPKTSNGELGYVAEFKDCEGNRIALHQK